jgi:hypothetical protein
MILVRLMGGLGNQMFQYAFGKHLALKNNTELKIDVSLLKDRSIPHEIATHRDYCLDIFNLEDYSFATEREVWHFNGNSSAGIFERIARKIYVLIYSPRLVVQDKNYFSHDYLNLPDNTCIVGRWQSELFFYPCKDQIRKEFTFIENFNSKIIALSEEIKNCNSICIHFRRGDLITSPLYSKTLGCLNLDYYHRALSLLKEKIKNPFLYIFSDDIEWCKNNIMFDLPFKFVGNEYAGIKAGGHLYLMSCCKHFIISNSTFAWWGAWLSESNNKIVIAPKNWYKDITLKNDVLIPENWIKL